jgi:predicted MFS family arabinose efflux permease
MLAWSLCTALTGLASSIVMLLVVRFSFGVTEALFPGAAIKALSERTEPAHRMTANGWMQSSSSFAVLLAPLLGAPLLVLWGWRVGFFVLAALSVAVFAVVRHWLPPASVPADTRFLPTPGRTKAVLRSWVLWRFALMFFGYDLIVWGLSSWVPSYLQTQRGISVSLTAVITLAPAACAGVAVVLGGRLSDRLAGRHRLIVVPAMACCAVLLVGLAYVTSTVGFVLLLTGASTCAAVCYMPIFAVPLRGLPAESTGSASALISFGGQLAGVVAAPAMGWLVDHYSYRAAYLSLVLGAALAIVLALGTPQTVENFTKKLGWS